MISAAGAFRSGSNSTKALAIRSSVVAFPKWLHTDRHIITEEGQQIFVTSRDTVKHRVIEKELGVVSAGHVASKSLLQDIMASLKGMIGGETHAYSDLMNVASDEAIEKVARLAKAEGATAVVRLRLNHALTMNKMVPGLHASVLAYGTAVVCRELPKEHQELSRVISKGVASDLLKALGGDRGERKYGDN